MAFFGQNCGVNTAWFTVKRYFGYTFWHFEYCFGYIFCILSIFRECMFIFLVCFWDTFLESWKHTPSII